MIVRAFCAGLNAFTALAAAVVSSPVMALGLGAAEVRSYLGQPLEAEIRLISRSEAELASVTAGLASADDFRIIGLDRGTLPVPLQFEVERSLDNPRIRVRSERPVNEPVIQLVVEVVWASGRMLRQYTFFLDPPTFPSIPPAPAPDRASKPLPSPQVLSEPEPGAVDEPLAETESETRTPVEPDTPSPVETRREVTLEAGHSEQTYLVKRNDTLWGIASAWREGTDYSMHQVMLAFQEQNPGAFNRGNINSIKRGATLQMPDERALAAWPAEDALREFLRQEAVYRNRWTRDVSGDELPTVADSIASIEAEPAHVPEAPIVEDEGRLELVPPAVPNEAEVNVGGRGTSGTEVEGGESLVEALARAEEELANAQQENEYLNERLEELEAELERTRAAMGVRDTGLAELENRLEQERVDDSKEAPVAVTPQGGEPARVNPWIWWTLLFAVVLVAVVVWWLRRLGQDEPSPDPGSRVDQPPAGAKTHETEAGRDRAETAPSHGESTGSGRRGKVVALQRKRQEERHGSPHAGRRAVPPESDEEAVELDSEDPATKLDLARAYAGTGDPESARAILKEVLNSGDEVQAAEARRMLDEL